MRVGDTSARVAHSFSEDEMEEAGAGSAQASLMPRPVDGVRWSPMKTSVSVLLRAISKREVEDVDEDVPGGDVLQMLDHVQHERLAE